MPPTQFLDLNPYPLGFVIPASAGTPVPILNNFANLQGAGIRFFALEAVAGRSPGTPNTGRVYIGRQNMNKSTGVGVVKYLAVGGSWQCFSIHDRLIMEADNFYVDVDTTGDGVHLVGYWF